MKIGLLEAHNSHYNEIFNLTVGSKIRYCRKHNYEFVVYNFRNLDRTPHWGRVLGIKEHLKRFDWLLYLDTDTLITNFSIRIENEISKKHNIIIGRMPDFNTGAATHLSSSALLVRNNAWSFAFLDRWYAKRQFINKPYHALRNKDFGATNGKGGLYYEQSAFHWFYDNETDVRKNVLVREGKWFNAREVNHERSDFLIHFARGNKANRIKQFLIGCKKSILLC